ncbi:Putative aliphatic sulfonates transport permease protein SsuC (plasmid) [Variovorax sp. SRS16]|uniref:ABC transporter permease n=1 Tax=Variovorax sp. SRS16 TaxID=282217 RepID=UPI0013187B8E|nr:ABC transporter permease subunit [Variovorax sp. SRS16]VTU46469.1 Putative aliphatic sulfonates transport permease protein SsuC [Variovorax sp. SRS16]
MALSIESKGPIPPASTAQDCVQDTPARKEWSAGWRKMWATAIVFVIFILLIEIGHRSLPPFLFPSSVEIWRALVRAVTEQYAHILITAARFLFALATATVIGWFLGLLMGAFRNTLGALANPALSILQAVPAVSWVLVAILWMSNVEARVWFICFMVGVPLYAVSVYEGVRDIDADVVEAIDQFRPSRWQTIHILLVPQSLVHLLVSMRSVSSLVLRILVFAELIGASTGVGSQMSDAQTNFQMAMIFAWTVIMIAVNFIIVLLIDWSETKLLGWRKEATVR